MRIGYARVSTDEQNLDLQLAALEGAGCGRIFEDRGISGGAHHRPGLSEALSSLTDGDVLVVWKLGSEQEYMEFNFSGSVDLIVPLERGPVVARD